VPAGLRRGDLRDAVRDDPRPDGGPAAGVSGEDMVTSMPARPRPRARPLQWVVWAAGMALAVGWALPLVWMVSTSVKPPGQVLTRTVEWLPRTVTIENYVKVMQKPVAHWLLNSTIVTVASTAVSLATGSMAGYALARLNFPGRNALFFLVLAVL